MNITYCRKCNHFFYQSKISHYCKNCKSVLIEVDMASEEFFKLSVNERYRLAYKLTEQKL